MRMDLRVAKAGARLVCAARMGMLLVAAAAASARSAPPAAAEGVSLRPEPATVAPGSVFTAAVHITTAPGWHTYWRNPGDAGMAPHLTWRLPRGMAVRQILFPVPQLFEEGGLVSIGYADEVALLAVLEAGRESDTGETALGVDVEWLVCRDACAARRGSADARIVVGAAPAVDPDGSRLVSAWRRRLAQPSGHWGWQARSLPGVLEVRCSPPQGLLLRGSRLLPSSAGAIELGPQSWVPADDGTWTVRCKAGPEPLASGARLEGVLLPAGAGHGWQVDVAVAE